MAPLLPPEIIFQVIERVGNAQDFKTLFACVKSSRTLAEVAATHLYRYTQENFKAKFIVVINYISMRLRRWLTRASRDLPPIQDPSPAADDE